MTLSAARPELSVVVPCFNESGNVAALTLDTLSGCSMLP